LCLLLAVTAFTPGIGAAPRDAAGNLPADPALPPAPPPPLYFRNVPWQPPAAPRLSPEELKGLRLDIIEIEPETRLAQQKPDDQFVPVSELPPEEKLPAGPMLVAAYVFVALALFAYLLSLSRRLNAVSREIARLDAQVKQR
jgi:CcmD family protein